MDQDRWKTVNHIFHAALEVSSSERQAFVRSASNGDPELHAEVEVLLRADQEAGSYLESPLLAEDLFSNSNPPLNPGDILSGRFRILRAVGEGGMGHVFEAYDSELAVPVALKIIRPEIASNPEALTRFRQEVRLARRITHPNVCRTFDIERETRVVDPLSNAQREVVFLTMEFLEGETLDSRIKRTGSLPLDEALHVARQITDALTAAHAIGIVHRDMKPANIMLVPAESFGIQAFRAVITDFGLARLDTVLPQGNHSPLSHSGRPIGTLAYMAPEQLEGNAISAATDIYSFGLILFEMVTGVRAFPSGNFLSGIAKRLNGPAPSPSTLVPDIGTSWCHAIEGCLRLNPAKRFQSAIDVIAVLEGRLPRSVCVLALPSRQRRN
jgi:serine/threonine protein kinase